MGIYWSVTGKAKWKFQFNTPIASSSRKGVVVAVANEGGKAVRGGDKPLSLKNIADGNSSLYPRFANSRSMGSWLARLPSMLPLIFVLLATPTVIFLSICTPPFQSPDEENHFRRSYQITCGELYSGIGGYVDRGIGEAFSPYSKLPFNRKARVSTTDEAAAGSVKWTGQKVYDIFGNTSRYPPTGYLPQVLGVALGRIAVLTVVHTLILSRLINGAFAIFISALSLYWCQRGKLAMFAILLMSTTMFLFGSCNQDASLISITCLAFALVSRQISEGFPLSLRMTIVLASALLIVSLGRPPYAALLLVLLIPGLLPRWGRKPAWLPGLSLAGLLAILVVIWWIWTLEPTLSMRHITNSMANNNVDAGMQVLYIFHHPGALPAIIRDTSPQLRVFAAGFVGVLGFVDTPMPVPYYVVMGLMLLVAITAEMVYQSRFKNSATVLILIATLLGVTGIFLIEYLTFTSVGYHDIEGVEGRYLIPLAIASSIGLPRLIRSDRVYRLATAVVVLCQFLTFFYLPKVIIERYYLR
jgi:uncharacterized membrane protein